MNLQYHRVFDTGLDGKYAKVASNIPQRSSVLEVGCHSGSFSRHLMALGHKVLGIEQDGCAAKTAQTFGVQVLCGDVTDGQVTDKVDGKFDVILMMDVLEHLTKPDVALSGIRRLLKQSGQLLITGPNVAYWRIRLGLLFGKWEYADAGIMDKTHVRFYTAQTWRQLIETAGYQIVEFSPAEGMIPFESQMRRMRLSDRAIDFLRATAVHVYPTGFTTVFFIKARLA
jgi:2-polyprenyl-3-methyl-5-hydroxy-6-metoxy-1,4-benzoquinol methylase